MTPARPCHLALALLVAVALAGGSAHATGGQPCQPWHVRTVATGLGVRENLEPDGRGGLLISVNGSNAIDRLTPNGATRRLIANVPSPGGQRIRGHYLYFNTGDSPQAAILGSTDGTIERYDLRSGRRVTWSRGLAMPNGLIFLPGGDAAVSRDSPGWGITRVPFDDPNRIQRNWVQTDDSNGMAVDPTRTWLYFDQTFQPGGVVMRARLSRPDDIQQVASLGQGVVLDDLTIDRRGILYITSNRPAPLGELIRLDPYTKRQCVIATGLGLPSAVKFGCGRSWPRNHLFVVGFEGSVYDVWPPAGVPAPKGTCDAKAPGSRHARSRAGPAPIG
jgi:hypothetical protein